MTPDKLTWHKGNECWSKVVGKKLSKDKGRLVQAQWYFTANREKSATLAAAKRVEWRRLRKHWAGHQALLEALGEPFTGTPHWFETKPAKEPIPASPTREENIQALRRASEPTPSEVAQMYEDMNIAECAALFMQHRKAREGTDFKATSNKSFRIDLDGALKAIDTSTRMLDLSCEHLEQQRLTLSKTLASGQTAGNYGRAMKMMLDWYFNSTYFFGGVEPKGIAAVFARYPKRREAKPKHLPPEIIRSVLAAAGSRRRLYLLLMLNTGMQPTDIPHLAHDAFDLKGSTVRWLRQKNQRLDDPSDYVITSHLWPETLELVEKLLSATPGPAFLTLTGKPLYHASATNNRQNAVTKGLAKFFEQVERDSAIEVSAKNFRQTGAQMIYEISESYEVSRVWLGRRFQKVDRSYINEIYRRLNALSMQVRDRLFAAKVFPLPPAKDRNYGIENSGGCHAAASNIQRATAPGRSKGGLTRSTR